MQQVIDQKLVKDAEEVQLVDIQDLRKAFLANTDRNGVKPAQPSGTVRGTYGCSGWA